LSEPKDDLEQIEDDASDESEVSEVPEQETDQDLAGESEEPAPDSELAEALREKDQFRALAQRAQADLVNFRSRVETEKMELAQRTKAGLIRRMLEIADSVDAALQEDATQEVDIGFLKGVEAIKRSFESALSGEGVERFESAGEKFDPRLHEALLTTESDEADPDTVIKVMRVGYRRGDDIIRPALVEVASKPS
jgi:molecular chaperone GrpE